MNGKKALISAIALTGAVVAGPTFAQGLDADRPGDVLVYPIFDTSSGVTTTLRLTYARGGTQMTPGQKFKFTAICGTDKRTYPFATQLQCPATDRVVTLTPNETYVLDVADLNPQCTEGFVVAYPVNNNTGDPTTGYPMIGSYLVQKAAPKRGMADQAIPIQYVGNDEGPSSALQFNGSEYEQLPNTLWSDFKAVDFNPTRLTELVLLSMDTRAGFQNYPTAVSITAWNQEEESYSSNNEFFCWNRFRLDDPQRGFRTNNAGGQNGDEYGYLRVDVRDSGNPFESTTTILGAILERSEFYWSARNLFFDGPFDSTTYYEN